MVQRRLAGLGFVMKCRAANASPAIVLRWLISASCFLLPGCAHVHVDADGQRHIVGFLMLTLPPAVAEPAADSIRARTLGLSITQSPLGGGLVLGYSDTTLAVVRNHSRVPKAALVDAQAAVPKEEP
jgi:hypothetical protein